MTAFRALRVFEENGGYVTRLVERTPDELPAGEVTVRVAWSSLNYKDALSLSGNKGVTRKYPHTPGIDAAGTVVASSSAQVKAGDRVIVTGYDLGMNTDGGFGECIRVPASWVVPAPPGLDLRTAMALGTAGLTAALCVDSLLQVGIAPSQGEVLVTGASGGVGSVAVMLLAQHGFSVIAGSGKADRAAWLKGIGAQDVIGREALLAGSEKAMLKERWAGVVDTVGGDILFNAVKATKYGGSVACCGLTAGANFSGNVFPFILRGVNLLGVDSVELPLDIKLQMWDLLANEWRLPTLASITEEIGLEQVPDYGERMLRGGTAGRILVRVTGD
ncbi:MAG: YhdH/YhfP family quinone oxidoreductase [Pseudomonadota bacterium]